MQHNESWASTNSLNLFQIYHRRKVTRDGGWRETRHGALNVRVATMQARFLRGLRFEKLAYVQVLPWIELTGCGDVADVAAMESGSRLGLKVGSDAV